MISLSTGGFFERSTRQMGALRGQAETLQQQISTQQRLERSSDDPVAAARLRTLSREERLAKADQSNSDRATTGLKQTDEALNSVAGLVIRAKQLALQSANATTNGEQRKSIGVEIAGIRESLLLIANQQGANGEALFGGEATGSPYADGPDGAQYGGTAKAHPIALGEGQSVKPGVTGPEVFAFDHDGKPTDLFAQLATLATALQAGGDGATSAASTALSALDDGLSQVTTAQTQIGARLNWVDLMDTRRTTEGERIAEEKSSTGGTDTATTLARLKETMTILEASQSSFVQLSGLSLFSLLR